MTEEQQSEECCLMSLVSVQLSVSVKTRNSILSSPHSCGASSLLQVPTCRVSQLEPISGAAELTAVLQCHSVCSLVVI